MSRSDHELLRGTLDLLILHALSWGPLHGLGVLRWILQATDDRLEIEEGALYPALHRLEHRGWLSSHWSETDRGRRARFYQLTTAGRKGLTAEARRWSRSSEVVNLVLATDGDGRART